MGLFLLSLECVCLQKRRGLARCPVVRGEGTPTCLSPSRSPLREQLWNSQGSLASNQDLVEAPLEPVSSMVSGGRDRVKRWREP